MINLARDDPIVLELAQLLRQHLLGCVGQESAQLTKALDATANQVIRLLARSLLDSLGDLRYP